MATKRILLTRQWDGHAAGEIVEEAAETVTSMVRKKYGRELSKREAQKLEQQAREQAEAKAKAAAGKGPKVETADAPPAAEDATVTPDVIKSQMALGSGGARGGEDGD